MNTGVLFQPDLFSQTQPLWQQANSRTIQKLLDVSRNWFPDLVSFTNPPLQIGAQEINSNNFLVATSSDASWILKRWHGIDAEDTYESKCRLLAWLVSEKQPVSSPLLAIDGKYVFREENAVWAVFQYIRGDYFSGSGSQLETAAAGIGQLYTILKKKPADLIVGEGPVHLSLADDFTLRNSLALKSKWHTQLSTEQTELLTAYYVSIIAKWDALNRTNLASGPPQCSHYDLHPHNLLMQGNSLVALLDFDSCSVQKPGFGLAFSLLKLVRQTVVCQKKQQSPALLAKQFIKILKKTLDIDEAFYQQLPLFAEAEVLRRIALILRLNFEQGNSDWNHVLPIQLRHLDEIDCLFRSS